MDTLVLSCMDPRLNEYLDNKYLSDAGRREYGEVQIWRNASGRLPEVEEIAATGAKKVILSPHTDCAAKKFMYESIKQHVESQNNAILEQAEELIEGHNFSTREEFDRLVDTEEHQFLMEGLSGSGMNVELEVIDTLKLNVPHRHGPGMLVVSNDTDLMSQEIAHQMGVELTACYIIQGPQIGEFNPDINLALDLGIKKINIMTETGETT